MRFLTFAFLPVVLGTVAPRAPVFGSAQGSADLTVVTGALTSCSTQVKTCDKAVLSLDVGVDIDITVLTTALGAVVSSFDTACSTIKSAGQLVVADLITLVSYIQPLHEACGQLIAHLIARKTVISGYGGCGGVAEFGLHVQGSVSALLEAVVGLIPGPLDEIVKFVAGFSGSFELGIGAFKDGNCTVSGPGKGSGHGYGPSSTWAVGGGYPTELPGTVTGTVVVGGSTSLPQGCEDCTDELATATPVPTYEPTFTASRFPAGGVDSSSTVPPTRPTAVASGTDKALVKLGVLAIAGVMAVGILV